MLSFHIKELERGHSINIEFLKDKLRDFYDDKTLVKIIDGLLVDKFVSFRTNFINSTDEYVVCELEKNNLKFKKLNLKDELQKKGYDLREYIDFFDFQFFILENRNDYNKLILLDIYKNGFIYLQNPSTFIPVLLMDLKDSDNILDMCAAPGGKSLFIKSLTKNKTNLTSVDFNKLRYEKMLYNFKMQNANIYTINKSALDLDDNLKFDKVLLDAPCSGSGILDLNNNDIYKYFNDILINKSIDRQKKLFKKAIKLTKSVLVYSTCSILNTENEEIVKSFKNKQVFNLKIYPDNLFEGFFVSKFIF